MPCLGRSHRIGWHRNDEALVEQVAVEVVGVWKKILDQLGVCDTRWRQSQIQMVNDLQRAWLDNEGKEESRGDPEVGAT